MRRILAVYGLKTRDYGYLSRFYPTARLIEACKNRSVPLRFLFPADVRDFLGAARLPDTSEDTICLIRGSVPIDTIELLESCGYKCVNSAQTTRLANDKLETALFLDTIGVPTPRTARAEDLDATFESAHYPLVAKPRHGSRGFGVTLTHSPAEAKHIARTALPEGDEWIFQEYVASSRGRDLRVFFAGDRIVACVERVAPAGEFASNASLGGLMRVPTFGQDPGEPWASMVRTIARETGLAYGTVDFLYLEGDAGFTVCEINAAPGFEALEGATGLDIAGILVDLLISADQ